MMNFRARLRNLRRALRQRFCCHRVRLDLIRRVSPELVECPCTRCGKVLQAPYGVALPARWEPTPPVSEWER